MITKVTISRRKYDELKHQAASWRRVIGSTNNTVVFNAVRDNGGRGIEAGLLAEKLRTLIERE